MNYERRLRELPFRLTTVTLLCWVVRLDFLLLVVCPACAWGKMKRRYTVVVDGIKTTVHNRWIGGLKWSVLFSLVEQSLVCGFCVGRNIKNVSVKMWNNLIYAVWNVRVGWFAFGCLFGIKRVLFCYVLMNLNIIKYVFVIVIIVYILLMTVCDCLDLIQMGLIDNVRRMFLHLLI